MDSFIEKQIRIFVKTFSWINTVFLKKNGKLIERNDGKELANNVFNNLLELERIKK